MPSAIACGCHCTNLTVTHPRYGYQTEMARRCDVAWHISLSEDVQRRPRTTLDGHQSSSFFQTICDDMRLFMRQCVIFNLSRKDTPSFTFSELQVWKCNSFPNRFNGHHEPLALQGLCPHPRMASCLEVVDEQEPAGARIQTAMALGVREPWR